MSIEVQDSTANLCESSSSSGSGSDDGGDFECNICFDLAAEPMITLCGHLYCWPCLYKWLRLHSRSQVCPVCKALIQEETLVPLYGRGKIPTDPRSKPIPGVEIPIRPAGPRPETASNLSDLVSGFMPTIGNLGMSAGFGGAFSPNFSPDGFSNAGGYGAIGVYRSRPFHGRESGNLDTETSNGEQADGILKRIHFVVFVLAFLALLLL